MKKKTKTDRPHFGEASYCVRLTRPCRRCKRPVDFPTRHASYRILTAAGLSDVESTVALPLCTACAERHARHRQKGAA